MGVIYALGGTPNEMTALSALFNASLGLLVRASSIWFIVWAIRRKGDFDLELGAKEQVARWCIVLASFALAVTFKQSGQTIPRLVALGIGMAFLCWPNLAYHLVKFPKSLQSAPPK